ncbi:MAG: Eco57I restriction-modification methylase domain-containing protein, partial [Rhodospirillaceae bacterium]
MIEGVSGPLVSHHYAEHLLGDAFAGRLGEQSRDRARRRIRAWWRRDGSRLGPASPLRSMFDVGAAPLVGILGFSARRPRGGDGSGASGASGPQHGDGEAAPAGLSSGALLFGDAVAGSFALPLLVAPWGAALDSLWGAVARESARLERPWVLCFNGRAIRLCDGRRTFARAYLEFDVEALADHPAAMSLFWGALRAEALHGVTAAIAEASERHGVAVSVSLRNGVRDALQLFLRGLLGPARRRDAIGPDRARAAAALDQAFTLVYRVLFLLFAESRALVPTWHPVYRRSYTIEGLRRQAGTPGTERGVWEALQAVSRLAHAGCHAGSLVVAPFNGRLFAPSRAPLAESGRLDDRLVADALMAITTVTAGGRRERVSFGDLGVEQLGAVYESALDYEPVAAPSVCLVSRGEVRKSSGTFYTPRAITEYLVRHTLEPLVDGASADGILRLRVLDPAMGSGALLVAACRYLAAAYEAAVVRERGCFPSDISDADRAEFRRLVAQHCLYGVDANPMAVQVARLSMWLTTLARGRPLSFLDHRFVAGDSLVGATLEDVSRQPPGVSRARRARGALPLFACEDAAAALREVVPMRARLAATPDDTAEAVRAKERLLADTRAPASAMTALRRVADLWCACWFWSGAAVPQPGPAEYGDLAAALRSGAATLPERVARPRLDEARRIAAERRFLHWTLEFPEVFFDASGAPLDSAGFDAIIGNPPWDMVRGDTGDGEARRDRRNLAAHLTRFVRQAGVYRACAEGHANQYQLFAERSLSLLRDGGRLGLVLPWGLASDHGSAALRRLLFERCATDTIVGFENAAGIFPIHRGVRFLLLLTSPGRPTREVRCRFGERDPAALDDTGAVSSARPAGGRGVTLTPALLRRLSGPGLAIPYLRRGWELQLV